MNFSLVIVVGKVVVLGNRDILVVGKVVVLGQKWGRFEKNPLVTLKRSEIKRILLRLVPDTYIRGHLKGKELFGHLIFKETTLSLEIAQIRGESNNQRLDSTSVVPDRGWIRARNT